MIVFPAIDIQAGRCVRLLQGDFDRQTVYGDDPIAMAQSFLEQGATNLHVVDLDGARTGNGENLGVIERIARLGIAVQTGGGIRTMDDVKRRMDAGVFASILGTAAVTNPALVDEAVAAYGPRILVGIDAKNGMVAVQGWEQEGGLSATALGTRVKAQGIETVVFTTIENDGMQQGPNLAASTALSQATGLNVIVSGGVGNVSDVAAVAKRGLYGVIIGKALYDNALALPDALAYQSKEG